MANITAVFFVLLVSAFGFLTASKQSTNEDFEITTQIPSEAENSTLRVLSRKRRYVVFPKGSSIQCVYCIGLRGYVPLNNRWQLGLTMGLAWMLPTQAHQLYLQKRDAEDTMAALAQAGYGVQHRADLYNMLGTFLDIKGLKGRECMLRAVCEAAETKHNGTSTDDEYHQGNFMEELHRILFTLPVHHKHKTPYDEAREHAGKCQDVYPGCQSFLDLDI